MAKRMFERSDDDDFLADLDRIAGPYRPATNQEELDERAESLKQYFGSIAVRRRPYDWQSDPFMNDQYTPEEHAFF